jgi:hypothetical protein
MSFSRIRDNHPGLATRLDIIVIYSILLNTRKLINERKGLCVRFNYHVERNRWTRNTDWENVIISEKHKLRNEPLKNIPSTVGTFTYTSSCTHILAFCVFFFTVSQVLIWISSEYSPALVKSMYIRAINKRFSSLWYIICMIRTYIIKPRLKYSLCAICGLKINNLRNIIK